MTPINFIHDLTWEDIPEPVRHQARRCLLDTLGVFVGGTQTELAKIIYEYTAMTYGGSDSFLWLDGRPVSLPGAALAHGMAIDALDMHDSCKPIKGHVGVAVVPVLIDSMKLGGSAGIDGKEFMTSLVMSYDIATRAGMSLHNSVCDYHTSGAWSALACAAIVARRLGLSTEQTRHALGIAEYHGPRSQMMRCIDFPTMLKDGSGWGAMAGASAGLMASKGFTGAPAITVEEEEVSEYWETLGSEWMLDIQCFKKYAVCYWGQAAVAGALQIQEEHAVRPEEIEQIEIHTFHNATRLAVTRPEDTEKAQYSLPYPVAAALTYGQVGWKELSGEVLNEDRVLALSDRIVMVEDDDCNANFPAERQAKVRIALRDGQVYDSGISNAPWQPDAPPSDIELIEKYYAVTEGIISQGKAEALEKACWQVDGLADASVFLELLKP